VTMRVLVTGSDGLVGTSILPLLSEEFDVVPFVESQWDIGDRKQGEAVLGEIRPDVLLNLAAITDVDGCEDRQELAFRVNTEAPGLLSHICRHHEVRIISFSTDYVFDGKSGVPYREEDKTNPMSIYGKSKRSGEEKILAGNPDSVIIRTEWVYGDQGESFITKVLRRAKEAGRVDVVDDQTGTPTYAKDLARPVAALIKSGSRGIFHVTNGGFCTWYDFALHVFANLGLSVVCAPIKTTQSARKAPRPSYSVLNCGKLKSETGVVMRNWQDAVDDYLSHQIFP
jgi:dTDP-4-dehydrorhamnose reductase